MIDGDGIFLLLTIRRDAEIAEHRNKLVMDINEDSVDCLLVDYDNGKAAFFSIMHDIRAIRTNYRRIRMRIQEKVENPASRNKLLAKYGARERNCVEDRLKKITTLLAEIAREHNADLVRERLKDLRLSNKMGSKQLNYRLSTFPYRKFIEYIDYKFYERGLSVIEVDARKTSITCPVCGYTDRRNRISRDTFRCRRCGLEFNAQYVACLNLFSRSNDGYIAIRSEGVYVVPRKAGSVVPANVASNEPPTQMKWLRGEARAGFQNTHSYQKIKHGQPPVLIVTCRTSSVVLCEHEIGNVLFIRDPNVRIEKTAFTGVLLVYSNLDVNTAYRVASFREYGFVESIIPIHCTLILPLDPLSLRECLAKITNPDTRIKLKVRARGVRKTSSEIYRLVVNILRELGVTVESSSSTCLFVEVIKSNVYVGVGSCKPVFKASISDS